ncbi:MAG: Rrf2 family transcriptional regulator [Saprospiraceae bacterium]|nr:Rrf2 family transcriptional regulator [Saprospiraceae bacterium]MBK6565128.1 Rrf2 family transcriptional regulator [Saprospiraceae bacterium]MBK8373281.1 Rrf2 family transcriptional regulator [Saprospiraceae bacterium]MBK8820436.1 Rrf2 family transcriptional regulator [Saprospiraceae bacterium]MBK9045052.1 Rrf2 family transcriptional regulator [Saprospiraceae bacterium]
MFSKACEYAIRSSIYISSQTLAGRKVSLVDVAEKIQSPEAFTSKILQKLVKNNIIISVKGPGGGFQVDLAKLESIKLKMIVEAFEGDILQRCSLGLSECSDIQPCPFHHKYKPVKEKLLHIFDNTSLMDLMKGIENGETFLRI